MVDWENNGEIQKGYGAMKSKRHRFVSPDKARAAAQGGFYQQIPLPGTFICSKCGEERNSIGQEDGHCLGCRWAKRAKEQGPN